MAEKKCKMTTQTHLLSPKDHKKRSQRDRKHNETDGWRTKKTWLLLVEENKWRKTTRRRRQRRQGNKVSCFFLLRFINSCVVWWSGSTAWVFSNPFSDKSELYPSTLWTRVYLQTHTHTHTYTHTHTHTHTHTPTYTTRNQTESLHASVSPSSTVHLTSYMFH